MSVATSARTPLGKAALHEPAASTGEEGVR